MSGNQMPVLTLDVNEEHLKRLEVIFEKYRNGLMIGPAGTPLKIPSNTGSGSGARQTTTGGEASQSPRKPSSSVPVPAAPTDGRLRDEKGRFVGSGKTPDSLVSNYKGRGETMFDKYLSGLGKNAQQTLKTYKQINSTLQTTTSRLNNLFKTTVSWGTKLAVMGVAGPFGFGMMARNVVEKQKNADELQATPGELKAAESTYSPYFSGVGNLLNTLAAAQNDTQHPAYNGLIGLGINPKKGAAENLPVLLERVAALAKEYEGSGLTQSMLRGRGLGWVNFGLANQLVKYQDKIPELNKEFSLRAAQNDSLLTSAHTSQYQNLTSNLENNWDRLTSGFQGAMAGNEDALIRISDGTTNAALNFMNGENFKRILTDVGTGLDKLGKYVNGPDFNNDLNNFAENVAKVTKALGGFVGFAVEHPWLFGAAVLAGPSRVGAVAATTTGVAARVVGGSLLGATAGTVAGLAIPTNNTPTTSEEMKGLEGRFNFDYFNEVQEWQKNNPGKVWPGGLQKYSNNVNRSAYLSRGIRNNNPGNLNFAGQKGATLESGPNARFASFPTMLEGIAALDRQVMLYLKRGKNTIDQIIDIYAPSSDGNNTSSYKSYLSQYTGLGVKEKIDGSNFELMRKLVQGIINHENGAAARAVSGDDVMRALAMNRGNVYSPNNASQVIRLEVQQKPGSDILAQLAGMQQIPG
ncbi:lytic transglycosylase domain-containing protein [Salmonella enterica subsp. enterica serovar Newport]|uniref:Lytic transglycosylase domain-containing protein n=1 Tax=Salmonella enterica I TaxID=59201 RepID=A0A3V2P0P6_SALET|nr:lytic transglycosylase domain-containing protein [Salmonella enterica subsp. enterica serovar Newport]EHW6507562.1 lytic transglycosylase domain-containing protein [Salmonella enterica]EAC0468652.1 lytic transglycosylase domain-containing protein [Salmonella enterica subsp. enterica serovar Newport]EBR9097290.1 lytic transglycosylase domain-containing protein [Salmonella enterica subsp. enterica serovar Newport]EBS2389622.1 lytic transglycosylase domain-containing protein [Salmonella enteric